MDGVVVDGAGVVTADGGCRWGGVGHREGSVAGVPRMEVRRWKPKSLQSGSATCSKWGSKASSQTNESPSDVGSSVDSCHRRRLFLT